MPFCFLTFSWKILATLRSKALRSWSYQPWHSCAKYVLQCFFLLDAGHSAEQRKAVLASTYSIACAQLLSFKSMSKPLQRSHSPFLQCFVGKRAWHKHVRIWVFSEPLSTLIQHLKVIWEEVHWSQKENCGLVHIRALLSSLVQCTEGPRDANIALLCSSYV